MRKGFKITEAVTLIIRPSYLRGVLFMLDMSQTELARLAGLHWTTVSRICAGRQMPSMVTLSAISDVLIPRLQRFGVDEWAFLDGLVGGTSRALAQADRESTNKERSKRLKQVAEVLKARRR